MKAKFLTRRQISYNGYSVSTYEPGHTYTAKHGREDGFIQRAIEEGHAVAVDEDKSEGAEALPEEHPMQKAQNKVKTPKRRK